MTAVSVPRAGVPRVDIAAMLLDRVGDSHLGLRTRDRDWTWDQVVDESAARGALARKLRADGPFHIGVLLDNVPDFVFWLGGAALAGPRSWGSTQPVVPRKWPPRSGTPTVS